MDYSYFVGIIFIFLTLIKDCVESQAGSYAVEFLRYQNPDAKVADNSSRGNNCQFFFYFNFRHGNEAVRRYKYFGRTGRKVVRFIKKFDCEPKTGGKWYEDHQPLIFNISDKSVGLRMNVAVRDSGSTMKLADNWTDTIEVAEPNKWVNKTWYRHDHPNIFLTFRVRVNCSGGGYTCLPTTTPLPTTAPLPTTTAASGKTTTAPLPTTTAASGSKKSNSTATIIGISVVLILVIGGIILCVVFRHKILQTFNQLRGMPEQPTELRAAKETDKLRQ